jgi:Zn-dependent protease with chaperone function
MNQYIPKPDLEGINAPPSSPLRDLAFMGLGFVLILIVGFYVLGFAGEWAVSQMSPETENKVFAKFVSAMPGLQTPDPQLLSIFTNLEEQSGLKLKLSILCDKDPNAFAIPGGAVFITSSLLKDVKTEMGIAFVMAHEIGHFKHRHHLKGMGRQLGFALAVLVVGMGESAGVTDTFTSVMGRAYSRDQETQADEYALDLVTKVYGHVNGAEEFFNLLLKKQSGLEKFVGMLGTHPGVEERVRMIDAKTQIGLAKGAQKGNEILFNDSCR